MRLAEVWLRQFQGIGELQLPLDDATTVLAENAWGRRSFLNALDKVLGPHGLDAEFTDDDFHQNCNWLSITLTFVERHGGHWRRLRYRPLRALMWGEADGHMRLKLRWQVYRGQSPQVAFINADGDAITHPDSERLARHLLTLHPMLRLGYLQDDHPQRGALFQQWLDNPEGPTEQQMQEGLAAVRELLARYLGHERRRQPRRDKAAIARQPINWQAIRTLEQVAEQHASRQARLALLGLFGALIGQEAVRPFARLARPLLVLDNPELRLHPVMLATFWSLVEQLPLSRLLLTQSPELLGAQDLLSIRRLLRRQGNLQCFRLTHHLRNDDYRRIGFHLRVNRPASLFARGWLLVEGETEIWLMSELAHIAGIHLAAEGIRVIDFAQCGLRPLLHLAKDMGIAVHVLCDGDEAGNRYAATTAAIAGEQAVTRLPEQDIEHFFYQQGYKAAFLQLARWHGAAGSPGQVIRAAMHRHSKPALALALAELAGERGKEGVPPLLRRLFASLRQQALAQAPK
ncbi:DUF2813 domain-containing protein [Gallaecimonas sp. GXIMD1310]|uniref:DUF2813 domain-containing protein n=1 Tax=Gallaecimonas sp. GXIMD1310 TaxID=3131926 RepID=UPI00324897EF